MLSLRILPGEYLTIGDDVVVQYDRTMGEYCKLVITAPKEVPVVRGEVWERCGNARPDCVFERKYGVRQSIPWNRSKEELLSAIRKTLSDMEKGDGRASSVMRKLDSLFPAASENCK